MSKTIDLLDEDKPISGQKFVCISFISPEKIIKQKEHFFFEEFLKQYQLSKSIKIFTQFINFVSYKYKFDFDKCMIDLNDFVNEEKNELKTTEMHDDYLNFIEKNEEKLTETFKKKTFVSNKC